MKATILLLASIFAYSSMSAWADDYASCQKAEVTARNCCVNPKSCMSEDELAAAQKLEKISHSRAPASEKSKQEIEDLKSDLNQDVMDNCHEAVKSCKTSCDEIDVKLAQKCEHDSIRVDMFKEQINSVIPAEPGH